MEEEAKEYFKKEPQLKIQHVLDTYQTKQNEKIKQYSALKKLTDQQKKSLM